MFIYIIFGSYFFTTFYQQSFNLTINGNGGFVGNYLFDRLNLSQKIIENNFVYFGLVFLVLFFFLISINFKISTIKKKSSGHQLDGDQLGDFFLFLKWKIETFLRS